MIRDTMVVFGGLQAPKTSTVDSRFLKDSNEVYGYSFKNNRWSLLGNGCGWGAVEAEEGRLLTSGVGGLRRGVGKRFGCGFRHC